MKLKKIYSTSAAIAFVVGAIVMNGCVKPRGCTDASAVNFESKAKKDDGSCEYSGNVVVWFNKATSDSMLATGVNHLTLHLSNVSVDQMSATAYSTAAASCESGGAMRYAENLGEETSKKYECRIDDQLGHQWYYNPSFYITANDCVVIELK